MDTAIDYIRQNRVTDKFKIIQILMERAERLSTDGDAKKKMVIEAYVKLNNSDSGVERVYSMIPLNTIEMIIEALIYASKTAMALNEKTGCLTKIKDMFRKKQTV